MSFAVVTDSLAGLPLEEVASRGLVVIPLSYYMNGEEHTCQAPEEYDSAAFFRAISSTSGITSYPSGCARVTSIPKRVNRPMTPWGTDRGLP